MYSPLGPVLNQRHMYEKCSCVVYLHSCWRPFEFGRHVECVPSSCSEAVSSWIVVLNMTVMAGTILYTCQLVYGGELICAVLHVVVAIITVNT